MKRTQLYLLLFACFLILLVLYFVSVPTLTLSSDGKVEKAFYYSNETEFSVSWRHSVEKEEWEEMFMVQDETINIDATRFKTFGAGVPSHAGKDTFIRDGWVYMTGIGRSIGKELIIRTGKNTNHRFIYGEETIDLDKKETAYRIEVDNLSIVKAIRHYFATRVR